MFKQNKKILNLVPHFIYEKTETPEPQCSQWPSFALYLEESGVRIPWRPFAEQPDQRLGDGLAWASGAALLVPSQLCHWSRSLLLVL